MARSALSKRPFVGNPCVLVPSGGDVAIKLSYVLERCPHFDPDSAGSWFGDSAAEQDYNVLSKWSRMTGDFDDYATRLANALNEIGTVSLMPHAEWDLTKERGGSAMANDINTTSRHETQLLFQFSSYLPSMDSRILVR